MPYNAIVLKQDRNAIFCYIIQYHTYKQNEVFVQDFCLTKLVVYLILDTGDQFNTFNILQVAFTNEIKKFTRICINGVRIIIMQSSTKRNLYYSKENRNSTIHYVTRLQPYYSKTIYMFVRKVSQICLFCKQAVHSINVMLPDKIIQCTMIILTKKLFKMNSLQIHTNFGKNPQRLMQSSLLTNTWFTLILIQVVDDLCQSSYDFVRIHYESLRICQSIRCEIIWNSLRVITDFCQICTWMQLQLYGDKFLCTTSTVLQYSTHI
eukprot:TRINITY_DN6884_c0_g1_i4.p1 TRINITY_DN6884_c0_g1~~TRINITY_DN6884_c0_g1_i4.p1  ORF type:complete len:264 (-),score=-21.33 TRINITY_DN6884_c0_g1_i4:622-1413(-)